MRRKQLIDDRQRQRTHAHARKKRENPTSYVVLHIDLDVLVNKRQTSPRKALRRVEHTDKRTRQALDHRNYAITRYRQCTQYNEVPLGVW